jgi:hypothetical protein
MSIELTSQRLSKITSLSLAIVAAGIVFMRLTVFSISSPGTGSTSSRFFGVGQELRIFQGVLKSLLKGLYTIFRCAQNQITILIGLMGVKKSCALKLDGSHTTASK